MQPNIDKSVGSHSSTQPTIFLHQFSLDTPLVSDALDMNAMRLYLNEGMDHNFIFWNVVNEAN